MLSKELQISKTSKACLRVLAFALPYELLVAFRPDDVLAQIIVRTYLLQVIYLPEANSFSFPPPKELSPSSCSLLHSTKDICSILKEQHNPIHYYYYKRS